MEIYQSDLSAQSKQYPSIFGLLSSATNTESLTRFTRFYGDVSFDNDWHFVKSNIWEIFGNFGH